MNFPWGPAMAPEWTFAAKSWIVATVSAISPAMSLLGASRGARSQ